MRPAIFGSCANAIVKLLLGSVDIDSNAAPIFHCLPETMHTMRARPVLSSHQIHITVNCNVSHVVSPSSFPILMKNLRYRINRSCEFQSRVSIFPITANGIAGKEIHFVLLFLHLEFGKFVESTIVTLHLTFEDRCHLIYNRLHLPFRF